MTEDENLYHQIFDALEPFIKEDILKMLWHEYDTNINEAINRSVSSFTSKDRTFSPIMSLQTRFSIAAGVQIAGHYKFWKKVLEAQGIESMGESMQTILKRRDKENTFRKDYHKKPFVKKKKSSGETAQISKGIEERGKKIMDGT